MIDSRLKRLPLAGTGDISALSCGGTSAEMKLNSCAICCLFRSSAFPRNYIHRFCLVSAFVRPPPRSNVDLLSICKCTLLFCRDLYTRTYPEEWGGRGERCGVEKSNGVSKNEWNFVKCFFFFFFSVKFGIFLRFFFFLIKANRKWVEEM